MKTNLKFAAAGIVAGVTSLYLSAPLLAAVSHPIYSVEKKAVLGPEKFSISISQISNTGKIDLHIEKGSDIKLTVTLRDTNGEVVSGFTISKKDTDCNKEYDFSQAEEGIYTLAVSDGHQMVVKQIKFEEYQTITIAKFVIN
jgi:hypothetical protein